MKQENLKIKEVYQIELMSVKWTDNKNKNLRQ